MDVMHAIYPVAAKYFLEKRGLKISSFTRSFSAVFDNEAKSKIDELYDAFHELYQQIEVTLVT
jgi:4-hydroxy-tetrahydrodipicolinate synthase